jgi:hypothetical protein
LVCVVKVRFFLLLAVHVEDAALHLDLVPRDTHHALDERLVVVLVDAVEDDDVPPLGFGEAVDELVRQDPVADLQRRHHALGRNAVRLDDVGAHEAEDQHERDYGGKDQLGDARLPHLLLSL